MDKKLSAKQIILITSTLFGLLFGSGNMIFPVHMGQVAGVNAPIATAGFIITGVGLPILAVVSIGVSKSNGFFSLCRKVSKPFAFIMSTVLFLTIGPLFVMPRSASISYGAGLSTIVGNNMSQTLAFLIFSLVFFAFVTFFSLKPSGITTWIGKIINPIFLFFLAVLLVCAIINPMGYLDSTAPMEGYETNPFMLGFINGYNTMDVLAGLAYGIIIVNIVKDMGIKTSKGLTKNMFIPSIFTAIVIMIIYILIIGMGMQSTDVFEPSSNGSIALNQISNYYFGLYGNALLTLILTLASIKTSIGLTTSCATTFNKMFPKTLNYNKWVIIFIVVSFLISNIGLDLIIELSTPVLAFLYPVCMVLIILAFLEKRFDQSSTVYKYCIGFTCIAAFFDFIVKLPPYIIQFLHVEEFATHISDVLPLFDMGFGWVIPAVIGFFIGIIIWKLRKNKGIQNA